MALLINDISISQAQLDWVVGAAGSPTDIARKLKLTKQTATELYNKVHHDGVRLVPELRNFLYGEHKHEF